MFDSTLLSPDVNEDEVVKFIEKSIEFNVRAVAVPWSYVLTATKLTEGTDIGVVVGIDFPLGFSPLEIKLDQIDYYSRLSSKITDFDVVLNLCAVKSRDWDYVHREAEEISRFVKSKQRVCKIIIEVGRLTAEEIKKTCVVISNVEYIDYVKTGTGFGPRPVCYEDVIIMKEALVGKKKIKVSGGVRTAEQVERFLQLGVDLFGSSHAVEIIHELKKRGKSGG